MSVCTGGNALLEDANLCLKVGELANVESQSFVGSYVWVLTNAALYTTLDNEYVVLGVYATEFWGAGCHLSAPVFDGVARNALEKTLLVYFDYLRLIAPILVVTAGLPSVPPPATPAAAMLSITFMPLDTEPKIV